jgi:hypothetical protein
MTAIRGGCHCGAVRYESEGRLLRFVNCHCPDCRKASGSAFGSVLAVESTGFKVVSGEENLVPYESSPGKRRCFCKTCGSHVFARVDSKPEIVLIRAGSLDDDPGLRPQAHIWVQAKAPWHEIEDYLPQCLDGGNTDASSPANRYYPQPFHPPMLLREGRGLKRFAASFPLLPRRLATALLAVLGLVLILVFLWVVGTAVSVTTRP